MGLLVMSTTAVVEGLLLVDTALAGTAIVAVLHLATSTMVGEDMTLLHLGVCEVLLQKSILHLVELIVRTVMVGPLQVVTQNRTMVATTVHLGQEALHEPMRAATMTVVLIGRQSFFLSFYVLYPWKPLISSDDLSNPTPAKQLL